MRGTCKLAEENGRNVRTERKEFCKTRWRASHYEKNLLREVVFEWLKLARRESSG